MVVPPKLTPLMSNAPHCLNCRNTLFNGLQHYIFSYYSGSLRTQCTFNYLHQLTCSRPYLSVRLYVVTWFQSFPSHIQSAVPGASCIHGETSSVLPLCFYVNGTLGTFSGSKTNHFWSLEEWVYFAMKLFRAIIFHHFPSLWTIYSNLLKGVTSHLSRDQAIFTIKAFFPLSFISISSVLHYWEYSSIVIDICSVDYILERKRPLLTEKEYTRQSPFYLIKLLSRFRPFIGTPRLGFL